MVTRQNLTDRLNAMKAATAANPITPDSFATFLDDWINYMTKDGQYDMGALDAWKAQSLSQSSQVSHTPSGQITATNVKDALVQLDSLNKAVKDAFVRPVARPAVTLDFANAKMIDPQYAFSRNSVGTYIDKNGQMRVAQANQPRFAHDSGTLECAGLLVEGSRTNLLPYSADVSTWGRGANANYVGSTSSLLGYPAHTFSLVATGNAYVSKSITIVANKTYSYSYYSSSNVTNIVRMHRADNSISRTMSNYTVTLVATGVYRHEITFTTLADELIAICHLGFIDAVGTFTVGMAQLEEGDFSTSYIPTVASAVTRQADVLTATSSSFPKNAKGYSLNIVGKYRSPASASTHVCEVRGNDTTGWNVGRIIISTNSIIGSMITGGVDEASLYSVIANNTEYSTLFSFAQNNTKLYNNGVIAGSDNVANFPNNLDKIVIKTDAILCLKKVVLYNFLLTDTEAIAITTPQTNKYPSILDMSGMAFVTPEAILRRTGRQEFSIDGTGASITRNIRRPYDFNFEIIDSDGVTITSQPAASVSGNSNNSLVFTAPTGKTITYAITPIFEY